ncbi:restriction endonuclease subunit S [Streptomyces sp. DSM 41972]|uniref:Restriction endonuclease subunit S n=1 Tax=Streptomyces althioticus subsp. attaecolombicae TaxID=3075534 RepID=A0ABU3HSW4_9ACTN|nr:restriction endonuclease subunit S [Streptomyces sp. DSM 41972]
MTRSRLAPWISASRWPTAPIRLVARLGSGHTPSRSKPEYWENCTVPWITLADVWQLRDGRTTVITDTKEKVSPLGLANSAAVKHPAGTVILSRTASVGFSAIMGQDMATSQDFATWTCGPKLEPRYLLHALRGMTPDLERVATGSTHKTIYMPDIEQLRVPLPPLEEQRRIADFLDAETARIDKLVALRDRQIRLAQEGRASSLNHTFKRETHSATRLKHLLATRPRYGVLVPQFVEGDGVRFIRVNDLLDLSGRANSLRRIPHTLSSQYARTITRPGDVLLSVVGTMGRSAIVPPELEGANIARAVASLRPATDVSAELVAAWLTTPDFIRQAVIATSSDTAQPTLGMEDLANFRLSWPSSPSAQRDLLHEVRAIQRHGNRLVRAFQAQSRLLAERRQALITAAVTGQFDVTTASGRNVTEGVTA